MRTCATRAGQKKMHELDEIIRRITPSWMQKPAPELPILEKLQMVIDQVLPGRLGVRILTIRPGELTGEMPYRRDTTNVVGYMHGGAIFTFGDTLAGALIWAETDGKSFAVTSQSRIRYLRPVREGGILRCTVRITEQTARRISLVCDFTSDAGEKTAKLQVEYVRLPLEKRGNPDASP